jgi:uncharacterized HhH-GPD family protein
VSRLNLHIAQDTEADKLISNEPLALLVGMVLDQQVPLEWAFSAPLRLKQRLGGSLDAGRIAAMDPDKLAKVFSERPALHRFPGANAKRVQQLCQLIVDRFDGRPAAIWQTATTGDELYARVKALPGFGEQKARIFIGLLGKQLGVRPPGWEVAAGPFGQPGTYISVADIVDGASLGRVRTYKREMKAAARA